MDTTIKRNSTKIGAVTRNNGVSENSVEKSSKQLNDLNNFLEAMIDSNSLKTVE